MISRRSLLLSTAATLSVSTLLADDWPQWRGPGGTGVSNEPSLPIAWSERRGIVWKCALPAWGSSTPALWGEAVFVTAHTGDDKLLLMRINKADGVVVWTREVGTGAAEDETTNLAIPSPATDGQRVVVQFGNGLLAAYDFSGELIWKRSPIEGAVGQSTIPVHTLSPVLFDGTAILAVTDKPRQAKQPPETSLIALDLRDGHEKWRIARTSDAKAEDTAVRATPLLIKIGDAWQLLSLGGNVLESHHPATGKPLWQLPGMVGGATSSGPTVSHGLLFIKRGQQGPLLAIRLGRTGKLDRRDIAWREDQGTPDTCWPVAWDQLLFTITDDGLARCCELATGRLRWQTRLKGHYQASPIAAEGRIYFLNTGGLCTVIAASPKLDKLTENQLDDETPASLATSDGRLYLRGKKHLYCLGQGAN